MLGIAEGARIQLQPDTQVCQIKTWVFFYCLPKGKLSEGPHEIHLIFSFETVGHFDPPLQIFVSHSKLFFTLPLKLFIFTKRHIYNIPPQL